MAAPTTEQSKPKVTEAEARDVAEAARETEWHSPSFVAELFEGRLRMDLIHPHPEPDQEDEARAKPFLDRLAAFMRDKVDADQIDRDCKVPDSVVQGLKDMGAFGIKIPLEYGGLGLSQYHYSKAMGLVSSVCGSTTALLSAHQSIGVPGPLKYFGTPEQKKKYLPLLAKGMISAFALTEQGVGSDPAAMETHAIPDDEDNWILNGEKLSRGRLDPQRREAVVHQRHQRRGAGGDGPNTEQVRERQGAQADHGLPGRDEMARGGGHVPL